MTALALIVFVCSLAVVGWQSATGLWTGIRYGQAPRRFSWWPLTFLILSMIVIVGGR